MLSDAQVERVRVMVSTGRQRNGEPWTAAAVQREIRRRFHVDVSRTTAWRYLRLVRTTGQGLMFE